MSKNDAGMIRREVETMKARKDAIGVIMASGGADWANMAQEMDRCSARAAYLAQKINKGVRS